MSGFGGTDRGALVIYGCYSKFNGMLRIVDSQNKCNQFELPISWYKGQPAIEVYDANDQFLGILVDGDIVLGGFPNIYNPPLSKFMLLDPYTKAPLADLLYFESTDCTGTPYSERTWPFSELNIFKNGTKYYVTEYTDPLTKNISSQKLIAGDCQSICYYMDPSCVAPLSNTVLPVLEVTPDITFPVAFPLKFK